MGQTERTYALGGQDTQQSATPTSPNEVAAIPPLSIEEAVDSYAFSSQEE
ncbi:hypothetical protein L1049_016612 [Liquidambar formosana]|uniref:Uncharacterized protein n=1 Tax=Liquidambar formosana TaxID=63359 RepID=A0AAP0S1N6_LIQFO